MNDLNTAFDDFCKEFHNRLNTLLNITDLEIKYERCIDLSAWIEYRVNLTDHFIADGCGKTAAVLTNFVYMAADIAPSMLPTINRAAYYNKEILPKIRRGTDLIAEKAELETWVSYYRSEFFVKESRKYTIIRR